jgi:hypothetical protein
MKSAFGLYFPGFSNKWFSIRKNGTKAIRRISPEHHCVQANPESTPPAIENATIEYLFTNYEFIEKM